MPMDSADNGNGRVTLAVIGQKLDEIIRRLDASDKHYEDHERRLSCMEQCAARREEQISNLVADVKQLESKDTFGSIIAGAMALVAGFIGWFK